MESNNPHQCVLNQEYMMDLLFTMAVPEYKHRDKTWEEIVMIDLTELGEKKEEIEKAIEVYKLKPNRIL
jgi:hypothetical protein